MKKIAVAILMVCALVVIAGAQKKFKTWTEWTEKDAQKILDDSPWGQTQVETDTSEMFYSPTTPGGTNAAARGQQGATNQATSVNYRIRLLSARPIRQAFARRVELQNPKLSEQLRAFAERKSDQWIVVAVDYDSKDQRFSGKALQIFNSANTGVLKNNTYLEVKGGKRIFLQDYMAPINDGMGAKFIFPRVVDGQPFVTADGDYLRFYSEMSKDIKLNMRFRISEMMYDGQLEY